MKRTLLILLFLLLAVPVTASATQPNRDMNMQAMQKMIKCMASINSAKMQQVVQSSHKIMLGIEKLCKQGRRDEAQAAFIKHRKLMDNNPEMQKMRKCEAMASEGKYSGEMTSEFPPGWRICDEKFSENKK